MRKGRKGKRGKEGKEEEERKERKKVQGEVKIITSFAACTKLSNIGFQCMVQAQSTM